jgi:hypothetical protein
MVEISRAAKKSGMCTLLSVKKRVPTNVDDSIELRKCHDR